MLRQTTPPFAATCWSWKLHAHAYALAIKKITGVEIEKMLPTPNINLDRIPEAQKYLAEGSHRRLYTFSPKDYAEMSGVRGCTRRCSSHSFISTDRRNKVAKNNSVVSQVTDVEGRCIENCRRCGCWKQKACGKKAGGKSGKATKAKR